METTRDLSQLLNVSEGIANYLINFSTRHSYIYVETPKVACSTIKSILQLAEVGGDSSRLCDDVHDRARSPIPDVRNHAEDFWRLLGDPATFRFSFVRNPFSRSLSCYLDKFVQDESMHARYYPMLGFPMNRKPTFRDFLRAIKDQPVVEHDTHWAPQTHLLCPVRMRYSFIGRFEFLELELAKLKGRLGLLHSSSSFLAPHATSADQRLRDFYGREEIGLVQSIYEDDFRTFGYGWSPDIL